MLGRGEPRHVLHKTENRHIHLVVHVHVDSLSGVSQCHLLRRGDDDRSVNVDGLDKCEVDVAGSGRCVYHEVVERSPQRVGQQLLDGVRSHTASPERGLVGVHEESDGQHLHPVLLDGDNHIPAVHLLRIRPPVFHLEHLGHGRTEDVGVEQTHPVAQLRQTDGQVGGHGAFAHTALAARHGNDMPHILQRFLWFRREFGQCLCLHGHLHVLAHIRMYGRLTRSHQ